MLHNSECKCEICALTEFAYLCRLPTNSGASTSWNPKGLSRPAAGKLYLYILCFGYVFACIVMVHKEG
jgi:hypothetical protein